MHTNITGFLEGKGASIQNNTVTLSYVTRDQPTYPIGEQFDPITLQLNTSLFDGCTTHEDAIEILEDTFWERIDAYNNSCCVCRTDHIIQMQAMCLGLVFLVLITLAECWRMG
jgi:hypothetical protein